MLKVGARWALRLVVAFLATIVVLGASAGLIGRFWLSDHLEEFRPRIEALIGREAKVEAHIERLSLVWHGLEPEFILNHTTLKDGEGRVDLTLDEVRVTPSLLALLFGQVEFRTLDIEHPFITVEKTESGQFRVAGIDLPHHPDEPGYPFVEWLFRQHEIRIHDGAVRFQDLMRQTPPVSFNAVNLGFKKSFSKHHLTLSLTPDQALASVVEIEGDLRGGSTLDLASWSGELKGHFDDINLEKIAAVLPLPKAWQSAEGSIQFALNFEAGTLRQLSVESKLKEVRLTLAEGLAPIHLSELVGSTRYQQDDEQTVLETHDLLARPEGTPKDTMRPGDFKWVTRKTGGEVSVDTVYLGALRALIEGLPLPDKFRSAIQKISPTGQISGLVGHWQGPLDDLTDFDVQGRLEDVSAGALGRLPGIEHVSGLVKASPKQGEVQLDVLNGTLDIPTYFDHRLDLPKLNATLHWDQEGGQTVIHVDGVRLQSPLASGELTGTLTLDGAGHRVAALKAHLDHADLNAIAPFLPTSEVSADTRHWVKEAFKQGQARRATMVLNGDLHDFPFAKPGQGVFQVHVPIEGVQLLVGPRWPVMTQVKGTVDFEGAGLKLAVTEAHSADLMARDVVGSVADLDADEPILLIQGRLAGPLQSAFDYVDQSPLKKSLGGLTRTFRARGPASAGLGLRIPLLHTEDTRVQGNVWVDGGELRNDARDIPPLTAIKGHLEFTESGASSQDLSFKVLGGLAHGTLGPGPENETVLDVKGLLESSEALKFYGVGGLEFVRGKATWSGHLALKEGEASFKIDAETPVLGDTATISVLHEDGRGVSVEVHSRSAMTEVSKEFLPMLSAAAEGTMDWKVLWKRSGASDTLSGGGKFTLLGRPAEFTLSGKASALEATFTGGANARELGKIMTLPSKLLSGVSAWKVVLSTNNNTRVIRFSSDLKGMAIDLPSPFGKAANELSSLNFKVTTAGKTDRLEGRWDGLAAFAVEFSKEVKPSVTRASIRLGDPDTAVLPEGESILVSGELASPDLEQWKRWSKEHPGPDAGSVAQAGPGREIFFDIALKDARLGRYSFGTHQVTGHTLDSATKAQIRGPELEGTLEWLSGGAGRFTAHLSRLALRSSEASQTPHRAINTDDPKAMPALELTIGALEVGRYKLGQFEFHGEPDNEGFKIAKLAMTLPHGAIQGQGRWSGKPGASKTSLNFELMSPDTGLFMQDLGYAKTLSQGKTKLKGEINWPGDPSDFAFAALGGSMDLDCQSGQFLNAEPGVGRLIGLISLQSLPRRVTLDFKDIFSQGFAFDALLGHIDAEDGILRTQNLVMQGPAAKVGIEGSADLGSETAQLHVRVAPAVGNSVSLATTLIGGPVAGAATWLFQKLFKDPLGQLLLYEYEIAGPWDDPVVKAMGKKKPAEDKKP